MDTNNDSNPGAVPAGQPVPAGRPNQYIGYTQRAVQPDVVVARPGAYTSGAPAAPVVEPVTAAPVEPEPIPPVDPAVQEVPPADDQASPIQIVEPETTPEVIVEPVAAPEDTAESIAVTVVAPSAPEPAAAIEVEATPPPVEAAIDEQAPIASPDESSAEAIQAIEVAVTPAPIAESPIPDAQPSVAPVAQPVGAPIDDFRPMPAASATPVAPAPAATEPVAAPVQAAQPVQPARPTAMSDVFTPPARPFASPAAPTATATGTEPAEDDDDAELNHISNHLANEAKTQPKHKSYFSFFYRHPKAVGALVAAFIVLGGGGGFYMMHSGAAPNPNVVASWVPFVSKDAAFTAHYAKAPKHVKLNSGDGYVQTDSFGEYGVRALDGSTLPDAVISADAVNYGNGKVVKQSYKTVSGNDALSGTIAGTYKGKPALMTFQFLVTSKDLYELYTVGYSTQAAPNTQYFFTTFKPADTQ
jgi:hypothetical protein